MTPTETTSLQALIAWKTAAAALPGVDVTAPRRDDYGVIYVTLTVDANPRTMRDITDPSVAPADMVAQIRKEAAAWTRANRRARRATAAADRW